MRPTVLKFAMILTLSACIVGVTFAADITPDMTPTPGPSKITSTGKWSVNKLNNESATRVRVIATPAGGDGGIAATPGLFGADGTYTLTVENLEANTEYDVVVILEYTVDGKTKTKVSQTYTKVKTK